MKKFLGMLMVICLTIFGAFAWAQEAAAEVVVSNEGVFKALLDLVLGYKGLKGAALTLAVVQFLILLLKSEIFGKLFKKVSGAMKLLIVSGLTLLAGILALKASGLSYAQALSDSANLALLQVFAHQVYLQFFVKKE